MLLLCFKTNFIIKPTRCKGISVINNNQNMCTPDQKNTLVRLNLSMNGWVQWKIVAWLFIWRNGFVNMIT